MDEKKIGRDAYLFLVSQPFTQRDGRDFLEAAPLTFIMLKPLICYLNRVEVGINMGTEGKDKKLPGIKTEGACPTMFALGVESWKVSETQKP